MKRLLIPLVFLMSFIILGCSVTSNINNNQNNIKNINYLTNSAKNFIKSDNYKAALPCLLSAYNNSLMLNDNNVLFNLAFAIATSYYYTKNDTLFFKWSLKAKSLNSNNSELYSAKELFFSIDTLYTHSNFSKLASIKIPITYEQLYPDEYIIAISKVTYASVVKNNSVNNYLTSLLNIGGNKSVYYLETKAYIWYMLGEILSLNNKNDEAIYNYNCAINAAIKTNYYSIAAVSYEKLGNIFSISDKNKSNEYYVKSSDFYLLCNDLYKSNEMLLKCKQIN